MDFNLAEIHEAIAAAVPERECIVHGARRLTWAQVNDRSRRLANLLRARGLGGTRERAGLDGWESGQDHLALYLYNGPEYLEGMLGAFKARVAPFNVNYRYVEEELLYLMRDARPRAHPLPRELRAPAREDPAAAPRASRSCCRSPTSRATTCCPARSTTSWRSPPRHPSARPAPGRPTTST